MRTKTYPFRAGWGGLEQGRLLQKRSGVARYVWEMWLPSAWDTRARMALRLLSPRGSPDRLAGVVRSPPDHLSVKLAWQLGIICASAGG